MPPGAIATPWVSWLRRSRSGYSAARIRYMVCSEHRYSPSLSRMATTSAGERSTKRGERNTETLRWQPTQS